MTGSQGVLRLSWSLLGRSWRPLGGSLGALGGLWRCLGRLLGRLRDDQKDDKENMQKRNTFMPILGHTITFRGAQKGDQNRPKSHPRRVQISYDFQERKKSSSRDSWSRLEPNLRHFGGHLGVKNSAPVLAGVVFGENSRFGCG